MYTNKSILNKVMMDYKSKCLLNSSHPRFLPPCETLNKYINDPCSIFNENIIPIGPVPPIPPMPPFPPMPPRPRLDHATFVSNDIIQPSFSYPLNLIELEGDTIEFDPAQFGIDFVRLAPDRSFFFSWRTETEITMMPFEVGGHLLLNGLDLIPNSSASTNMVQMPGIAVLSASGIINTTNILRFIQLQFLSNIGPLQTSATLYIELLP